MAGAGENKHFNSGSAGGAHPALSKPIFCARAEARPPQGRRRRGLGPICEPMALDRFSDNEVPALDAADEPEPTSATPPRGAGAAGLVP